jgi:hypothetical protein
LRLSIRSHRNRLVAFVAAIALMAMSAVYSAHGLGDLLSQQHAAHCDLCVHLSGTAGSPTQAFPAGKPVLVVHVPAERPNVVRPVRRGVATSLPRGPPV